MDLRVLGVLFLSLLIGGCGSEDGPGEEIEKDSFSVVIQKVQNDFACTSPELHHGELKAYVLTEDSVEVDDYSVFTFQWFENSDLLNPIQLQDSSRIIGLAEGTYTVVVTDTNGTSFQEEADINDEPLFPKIRVVVRSHQTNDINPNGKLEVLVEGGGDGCSFQWEDSGMPLDITTPVASGLIAGTYTVVVTYRNGCQNMIEGVVIHY